jgi:hypothetical protein
VRVGHVKDEFAARRARTSSELNISSWGDGQTDLPEAVSGRFTRDAVWSASRLVVRSEGLPNLLSPLMASPRFARVRGKE